MNCLARNRWPGNVRELSNLLERLAILYPDQTISAADLPERYRNHGAAAWIGSGVRLVPPAEESTVMPVAHLEDSLDGLEIIETLESGDSADFARVSALAETMDLDDLEPALPSGGIDLKDHLSAIEIGLIRRALEEADGTVAEAARLLKIRRTTLVEKLRKYRLSA